MMRTWDICVWKSGSPHSGSFLPQHQALWWSVSPPLPTPATLNNLKQDGITVWEQQEEEGVGAVSRGTRDTHTQLTAVLSPGCERRQQTQGVAEPPQHHPLLSERGCTRCRDARCYRFLEGQKETWASWGPWVGNAAINQAGIYLQP